MHPFKSQRAKDRTRESFQANAELLEKVQVEAARSINCLRINSSRSCLYDELGWGHLHFRRTKHTMQAIIIV